MIELYGLLGAGGQSREAEAFASPDLLRFRAVSAEYLDPAFPELVDIRTTEMELLALPVLAAVGAPGLRRELVQLWAGVNYRTIIAQSSFIAIDSLIGEGSLLAPHSAVSVGAALGRHVQMNIGASVSHDTRIGDFVTLGPGARISGNCIIGPGVFVGIGAAVSNGISIVAGSVIGAGSVVVADITEPGVYVGAPARKVRAQESWLRVI